jgi:hypothetical protein
MLDSGAKETIVASIVVGILLCVLCLAAYRYWIVRRRRRLLDRCEAGFGRSHHRDGKRQVNSDAGSTCNAKDSGSKSQSSAEEGVVGLGIHDLSGVEHTIAELPQMVLTPAREDADMYDCARRARCVHEVTDENGNLRSGLVVPVPARILGGGSHPCFRPATPTLGGLYGGSVSTIDLNAAV